MSPVGDNVVIQRKPLRRNIYKTQFVFIFVGGPVLRFNRRDADPNHGSINKVSRAIWIPSEQGRRIVGGFFSRLSSLQVTSEITPLICVLMEYLTLSFRCWQFLEFLHRNTSPWIIFRVSLKRQFMPLRWSKWLTLRHWFRNFLALRPELEGVVTGNK